MIIKQWFGFDKKWFCQVLVGWRVIFIDKDGARWLRFWEGILLDVEKR